MIRPRNITSVLFILALIIGISSSFQAPTRLAAGQDNSRGLGHRGEEQAKSSPPLFQEHRARGLRRRRCAAAAGSSACPRGQYCHFYRNTCSRRARGGFCRTINPFCTREHRPVCGCDGVTTYSNPCLARSGQAWKGQQAGISSYGEC